MVKKIKYIFIIFAFILAILCLHPVNEAKGYYIGQQLYLGWYDLAENGGAYRCQDPGNAQCNNASCHLYEVTSISVGNWSQYGGSYASISSATGSVSWSKEDNNTYKVGPYKVNYTGSVESVLVQTNKGTYSNGSGGITVGSISSGNTFYIYVNKNQGIREINSVHIRVKSDIYVRRSTTVYLTCIWSASSGHGYQSCYEKPIQNLATFPTEYDSTPTYDEVTLPGAPGVTDLIVEKSDKNHKSNKVYNARFEIYKDGELIAAKNTNRNGIAKFEDLFYENYVLKEVSAGNGYKVEGYAQFDGAKYTDLTNIPIDLTDTTEPSVTIHVYDECLTKLKIKKYDRYHTGNTIKGATFELWKDGKLVDSGTTNSNGEITFKDLEYGDYIVKETAIGKRYAIEGYAIFNGTTYEDLTNIPITLTKKLATEDHLIELVAYDNCLVDLQIEKYDRYHPENKIAGVTFELWKDGELVKSGKTNANGQLTFKYLEYGDYVLKEVGTPKRYEIKGYATFNGVTYEDLTNIPITLTPEMPTAAHNPVLIHVYDNCLVDLQLEKYDRYHPENRLAGVRFELWKDGECVATKNTDINGSLTFKYLEYGDYILKEVRTIDGYEIAGYATFNGATYEDLTNIPITLTPEMPTAAHNPVLIHVYNNCLVDLVVEKYDRWEPEKVVEGVEFQLYKEDGTWVATKLTDSSGKIRFEDLQYGTYILKETKTVPGYEIAGYAIFNGTTYTDLKNMSLTLTPELATKDHNDLVIMAYDNSFLKLGGKVFIDEKQAGKVLTENGYQDSNEVGVPGIPVTVYREDGEKINPPDGLPNPVTTDGNGRYDFGYDYKLSKQYGYYVKFDYDGQNYEPTTYRANGPKEDISYSTDGKSNRMSFNKEYEYITGEKPRSRTISAYCGSDGIDNLTIYHKKSDPVEIMNINLGLLKREEFDLNLKKDLNIITVSVNGKDHTYYGDRRNLPDQDIQLDLRGTDFNLYERELRGSDIAHEGENELNVKVEYKIRIMNESLDDISGQVTNLLEYFSNSYTFVPGSSYSINNAGTKTAINWTNPQMGSNGYYSMQTTNLSDVYLRKGDMIDVYLTFEVKREALKSLINTDTNYTITENFAEIGGYRTTYSNQRQDLNGNVITTAGEVAGLLDKDSVPNNFRPEELNEYLQSEEYKNNTSSSEKKKQIRAKFEDDADKAPGLKLKLSQEERSLEGTVFEDKTTVNDKKERLGDGILSGEDTNRVAGATVQLLQQVGDTVKEVYLYNSTTKKNDIKAETKADAQGNYKFEGYLPADGYFIRYLYGDTEETARVYNGQDYKSTIKNYDNENAPAEYAQQHQGNAYWYNEKVEKRISDATDDLTRRKVINEWAKTLNNYKAKVLNKENTTDLQALIDNTWMQALTDSFSAEIEYARKETRPIDSLEYKIINIDFGLAKRPESELTINKRVARIQVFTNDEQTLFDSTQQGPNLAWLPGSHVQVTMDENLMHGATLKIHYGFQITNTGETDYVIVNGDEINIDELYYTTGHKSSSAQIAKTKAEIVLDYVENNLGYRQETIQNETWEKVERTDLQKGNNDSLVDDALAEDIKKYETLVKTKTGNVLLQSLEPGQSTEEITLVLSRVLSAEHEDDDDFIFDNGVEIILSSNEQGRRSSTEGNGTSIPGNLNPVGKINANEPDTHYAENVTVLVPFGENRSVNIIGITIVAILILGTGIIVIKKKIL